MAIIDKVVEKAGVLRPQSPSDRSITSASDKGVSEVDHRSCKSRPTIKTNVEDPPPVSRTSHMVTINLERLRTKGILTPDAADLSIATDYRNIKRPLLKNAFRQDAVAVERGNLIMVTSALPGEGKTFTAINLAISVAMEVDKRVLLVDADVLRPTVSSLMGLSVDAGLIDLLLEENADLSKYLLKTNIPKLTLLPAGNRHHLSTELLASEAMARLTGELTARYPDRVIIFDSPPLLATTEAGVLASFMGQILIVVEADKTSQITLERALGVLDSNATVGLVLNKDRRRFGSGYAAGYYAY